MRLASLDGELFAKKLFSEFSIYLPLSINSRRINIPPFDASRHGDSDDMCYIFLRSLGGEIFAFNDHFLGLPGYFW